MTWLVTGGAGYIGAHIVRELLNAGESVVAYDNLVTGHRNFLPDDVVFVEADILDRVSLERAFVDFDVTGVIHVAGYKYAGVSVQLPLHTYEQNVTGMAIVLSAMEKHGIDRMVFSSSAATYGTPREGTVTEQTPTKPESPYGESKLIGEWMLRNQSVSSGLRYTALRYFNVVGSGFSEIPDLSPHNLFPKVFGVLLDGRRPVINGNDYPTPDGTCVRDYVHITDLAQAHVSAAQRLDAGLPIERIYNLGSGEGVSVREIISAIARVTQTTDNPEFADRRPGDPARIVADGSLAARDLGWRMRHSLDDMVNSAWRARQQWEALNTA